MRSRHSQILKCYFQPKQTDFFLSKSPEHSVATYNYASPQPPLTRQVNALPPSTLLLPPTSSLFFVMTVDPSGPPIHRPEDLRALYCSAITILVAIFWYHYFSSVSTVANHVLTVPRGVTCSYNQPSLVRPVHKYQLTLPPK